MKKNRLRSKYVEYYNPLSINPPKQRVTKHRADFFSSFFPCQTRCATVTRKFIGRHDFARVREPVDQKEEAEAWSLEAIKGSIFRKSTRSPYRAIRRNHAWKRVRGVQGKWRYRIRGRRRRRRRRKKRIEREKYRKGMNIHEPSGVHTNSDRKWKMLSWMGIEEEPL